MRPKELAVAWLLIISSSSIIQILGAEDLYLEGEEDPSDEFLEVKSVDVDGHAKRQVSDFFNFWAPFTTSSTTTEAPEKEVVTNDPDMEELEEDLEHGSGQPDRVEPELGEKTLRVTFVVMEPYQTEFSNRDSTEFQNFSRSLADAVNVLYERLPGTQRASLVRIQSRVSNEFSCKVTLDIVTTGYDNTERITQLLQDHIRNSRKLGQVEVSDDDFSTHVIDPGLVTCAEDELRCSDDTCVPGSSRCNGFRDCDDGADEEDCPNFDWNSNTDQSGTSFDSARNISCYDNPHIMISESQRCDGNKDCPLGDDEDGCGGGLSGLPGPDNTTPAPETTITQQETLPETCPAGEFSCDDTRCVSFSTRCDGLADCTDGTDEQGCKNIVLGTNKAKIIKAHIRGITRHMLENHASLHRPLLRVARPLLHKGFLGDNTTARLNESAICWSGVGLGSVGTKPPSLLLLHFTTSLANYLFSKY